MTRTEAIKQATEIANKARVIMAVVLEGPHRDEHAPADSHGFCPAEAVPTLYKYGTVTDTIKPQPRDDGAVRWKVMPCPDNAGRHPFHDHRWIATADAEVERSHDPRQWALTKGSLICRMMDGPPENAHLAAAAPVMRDALKAALSALNQIRCTPLRGKHKDSYAVARLIESALAEAKGNKS